MGEGCLTFLFGGHGFQTRPDIALERKVGANKHEHDQGRGLNRGHLNRLAGQGHADEQSDGGRRRWKKGINRSQTLHVQHEGNHPHG